MVSACTTTKIDTHHHGNDHDDHSHHDNRHRAHERNSRDHNSAQPPERIALVRWAAGLGAVTAEAVAVHLGVSLASARGRLRAAEGERLLTRWHPLTGHPALYAVTRTGLRKADARGLDPCRVSASNALHLIECARVAAALERCYPDHRVQGERELRGEERERHCALASAELDMSQRAGWSRHRPDLVLWPVAPEGGLPVAVEVELTVKAPERLAAICRAWARARCVSGVLYLATPEVERAVLRAIDRAQAHERVVVVLLDALSQRFTGSTERTVPSSA
jgi:hypothetical protein